MQMARVAVIRLESEIALTFYLSSEDLVNQVASLLHFWKREIAVQVLTIASGAYHTSRTKN